MELSFGLGVLGSWGLTLDSGVVGPGVPRKKKENWGPGAWSWILGLWVLGCPGEKEKKKTEKKRKKETAQGWSNQQSALFE